MALQAGTALARIVIAAPRRRLELVLPEHLPIISMMHVVLRHAEEPDRAGPGDAGGWSMRRTDGTALDLAKSLAAQNVRDGETLHLLPARTEWPEPDFDDVVETIAAGSRHRGAPWGADATRMTGLVVAGGLLMSGLGVVAMSGEPWWIGGVAALVTAAVLLATGTVLSRALADSMAGSVVAGLGLPYALLGGALLVGGVESLTGMGAPHLLAGSGALLLLSVIGYLGVGDANRVPVAGVVAGLYGLLGGGLALGDFNGVEAAAVVASVSALLMPALPLISVRMVRLPLPSVPRTSDDLVKEEPPAEHEVVYRATARADEILTGAIFGSTAVTIICLVILALGGSVAALLLVGIVALGSLLRARLLMTVRHRVPLLAAGLTGLTVLPLLAAAAAPAAIRVALVLVVLVLVAAITISAGLTYSRRPPSPRMGKYGDILDVMLQLAVIPVACSVLGLYGFMRAING
ncbi:MAG: type VII secretion integral membrane protein EccD [Dactylosporangium sp.]|nr:type VII secretion integral membrane protein EccD [Dactylosporangium sp.]NNJ59587.1 type VII secretion integral membrane protein EccD [Dactylosporangium sp.]